MWHYHHELTDELLRSMMDHGWKWTSINEPYKRASIVKRHIICNTQETLWEYFRHNKIVLCWGCISSYYNLSRPFHKIINIEKILTRFQHWLAFIYMYNLHYSYKWTLGGIQGVVPKGETKQSVVLICSVEVDVIRQNETMFSQFSFIKEFTRAHSSLTSWNKMRIYYFSNWFPVCLT